MNKNIFAYSHTVRLKSFMKEIFFSINISKYEWIKVVMTQIILQKKCHMFNFLDSFLNTSRQIPFLNDSFIRFTLHKIILLLSGVEIGSICGTVMVIPKLHRLNLLRIFISNELLYFFSDYYICENFLWRVLLIRDFSLKHWSYDLLCLCRCCESIKSSIVPSDFQ